MHYWFIYCKWNSVLQYLYSIIFNKLFSIYIVTLICIFKFSYMLYYNCRNYLCVTPKRFKITWDFFHIYENFLWGLHISSSLKLHVVCSIGVTLILQLMHLVITHLYLINFSNPLAYKNTHPYVCHHNFNPSMKK